MKCTSCLNEIKDGTRVCRICGNPVSIDPALEDLYFSRLTANAPPGFAQKVRSAGYQAKERRTITALLFTIANLDSFEQKIPTEERTNLLNRALDRFSRIIFQYEGTIAKLWENTVLAFFGAPITHEDDPLRGVHAAASILEDVQDVSGEIESSFGVPLKLKMILNTGQILIGDIKSNLKFDFKSLNNTLECMDIFIRADLPTCKAVLFDDTYRFVKTFVECTPLEDIDCNETTENYQLWQLDEIINHSKNLHRLPVIEKTALIGRDRELDLLLELSETVLAGLGRVGLILGEPGIGKSRLIMEWRRNLRMLHQPTQVHWIEAHGQSFGRELAYHLMKDLLRSAMDIPNTASKHQVKDQIHKVVDDLMDTDQPELYQYLAHLMDIQLSKPEEERIHRLNASELRNHYLTSIRTFFHNLSLEQPLIIILEDLHWADESSVDLLIELLSMSSSCPILFCLTSRLDRDSSGWRLVMAAREHIGPRLTEIELSNLDEQESQSLVKQLIDIQEIPEIIRTMVLGKSEGNPYFIEELVRMLVNEGVLINTNDRWVIAPHIDPKKIPDSLQGLLAARIDRLPPEARFSLRVASVIGRTFPERVIEHVMAKTSPDLALMEQLSTLESIGMVKVAQVNPELTYKFEHILLHDAAYHSIFEETRSDLHLNVGNSLENLYPDQKERLASQLAHHFLEGQDTEKAFHYLDLAGHVAMDSFANAEAETYYRQAIQLTESNASLAHLYTDLGEALAQQAKHREAIQAWKNAIRYHKKLENSDRLARIYAWSARSAWWGYDPKHSLEICLEGLKAVEGAVESPDIAYLVHETGRAYLFNNKPEKARAFSEQALEMAKRLNAYDVQAEALATIGILPNVKPQQAIAALEMAVKISESNNLFGPASRAYINLAAVIDNLGDIRLARDYRKRAIQLGNKAGGVSDEFLIDHAIAHASLWLADFTDAETLIERLRQVSRRKDAYLDENTLNLLFLEGLIARLKGDFNVAIEILTDLLDRARQTNDYERMVQANRVLAEVIIEPFLIEEEKSSPSNIDIALNMVNDVIHSRNEIPAAQWVSTYCLLSTIYALKGNIKKSTTFLEDAQAAYRKQPAMQDRVNIVLAQARLEAAQNNYKKALDHLAESVEMLEKMEGRWWRARILFEMGNIHLKRNEPEDIDLAQNFYRESLSQFNALEVNTYPDVIIDKLRRVKHISRAQAIAHRKITQELAEAGRVQHTFIPTHSPEIQGYSISGVLLPARETSGDFYDFMDLGDGKLGVVVADVGDKGAGAALYMAMSRTLIRTYAGENRLNPRQVIHEVNRRILTDTQRGIFLTVVFGVLDPKQGTFTYVNAGHNPPVILTKNKEEITLTNLTKTGTLVGIFEDNQWEECTIEIQPGEILVLYTDGITEAQNEEGAFFGYDRLANTLKSEFSPSAETFRNAILESVQAFTGTSPRLDDVTLIIIARNK